MKSHNRGHFCQWPVCVVPVVTDLYFSPSTMHHPLHSAHSPNGYSQFFWYLERRFGHLVIVQFHQFLSMFPLFMRLVKKILDTVLLSHIILIKVVRHRQVDTGCPELWVDLMVDGGLWVLVVVLVHLWRGYSCHGRRLKRYGAAVGALGWSKGAVKRWWRTDCLWALARVRV